LCGLPQGRWPIYVVKELMDNAVAALEEHGKRVPIVRVTVTDKYVEVGDNGPGVSDAVLEKILDFDRFGGSNRHHKLPTRGAQGNAFMTLVGIAASWKRYLEVRRPNEPSLSLEVRLDTVRQEVDIVREEIQSEPEPSSIRVPWPELPTRRGGSTYEDVEAVVRQFAWMNPHVTFFLNMRGKKLALPQRPEAAQAFPGGYDCGAVTWFTQEELAARLAADVRARPFMGTQTWLREFAFVGKVNHPANGTIANDTANMPEQAFAKFVDGLRTAAIAATSRVPSKRAPTADDPKFSPVGEERLAEFLIKELGADSESRPQYHVVTGTHGSTDGAGACIPYMVEVCLIQMPETTNVAPEPILAMNRTVLYGSPSFKDIPWREKVRGDWRKLTGDIGGLCRSYQIDHGKTPCAVVVHATCPSPGYAGYGKQQFDTSWLNAPLSECMERVTLEARRQRAGEIRRSKPTDGPVDNIRQTVFKLFPDLWSEATEDGTIPVMIRQMYYATRKVWHLHHDKDLQYATFCTYVDEYEVSVGRSLCYRDPRGTLIEPHSGRSIRLGTDEMAKFNPRKWEGHTIIFVEKEGFAHLLKAYGVTKRYDAIIIGSKGFAVEACREALQKYRKLLGDMVKIIALHDADPAGYGIGYDLSTNLPRFGDNIDVRVMDVGLTMRDARIMGLQDEPFDLSKPVWSMIKRMRREIVREPDGTRRPLMDQDAWDAFMPGMYRTDEYPNWVDKPRGRRVELNAMAPRQFIDWLEAILDDKGCKKVRPPDSIVNEVMTSSRENMVRNEVGHYMMRMLGEDAVMEVIRRLSPASVDLDGILAGKPESHWTYIVEKAARDGLDLQPILDDVIGSRLIRTRV
jgi:hypothetical protein